MTSSYSTRRNVCPRTPETKPHIFKMFQHSPKSSVRDPSYFSQKKQITSNKSVSRLTSANLPVHNHLEQKMNASIQQELGHLQHCSSSINESQLIRERNVQLELAFDKPENNNISMVVESSSMFLHPDIDKIPRKNSQGQYQYEKKSYRIHRQSMALGVPYRKCHSSMQEKIVNIINKIKGGRQCPKQIQTLIQRIKKVSTKELSNRYFISGIHVIHRLVSQRTVQNQSLKIICLKLEEVIEEIKSKIFEQLDSIKMFEIKNQVIETKKNYDSGVLIRRAYQILRKTQKNQNKEKLQNKAIQITNQFIEKQPLSLDAFWGNLQGLVIQRF